LKQYVEGLSGEQARRQACRSRESAFAAEAFMNHAGESRDGSARFDLVRCSVYIDRTSATGLAVMPMALPVLHLIEIPQEGLSFSSDVQTDDLGLGPEDVLIPGGLAMSVNALKSGAIVYVTGTLSGTARRQCVRCLKEYDDTLRIPVVGEYHRDTDLKDRTAGRESPERSGEEVRGDDVHVYEGEEIDLGEMLREHVLLSVPMQPLCHDECQGLCPVCGQDLNVRRCECREEQVQSPFAVLKKLRETLPTQSKRTTKMK